MSAHASQAFSIAHCIDSEDLLFKHYESNMCRYSVSYRCSTEALLVVSKNFARNFAVEHIIVCLDIWRRANANEWLPSKQRHDIYATEQNDAKRTKSLRHAILP